MEKNKAVTHKWSRWLVLALLGIALLAGAMVLTGIVGIDYLVDIWWFNALGYGFYYWQRVLYRYAVFALVMLFFFTIFFLNFWIAARYFKKQPPQDTASEENRRLKLLSRFQAGSIWFYGPLSLLLSIPLALPLFHEWERFLFFIFGRAMGMVDPFLGKDASFYLFAYPIYLLIQHRLLLALLVLTIALLVLYAAKNRLRQQPLFRFKPGARWHISLLILVLFGLGVWGFMLQRYGLVYDTSHQDLFTGPGYVQMRVILPLIWGCMATLAVAGLCVFVVIHLQKGYKTAAALVLLFLAVTGVRYTRFLPQLVQTYIVKPNQVAKESPYIAKHVQATLDAYRLSDVEVREFSYERFPTDQLSPPVEDMLRNIPVWDAESLAEVFQQLQELRTYYMFPTVSVGRYQINGREQQVFVSPREIEFNHLPGGARNWINDHLIYTHGFGAVMVPASQSSGNNLTWYLRDIPPTSAVDLKIGQPRLYYGMGNYLYSIVPNRAGEMDFPKGERNVLTEYDGRGGVPISSLLRKGLFAYYLKNKNIFFSTDITDKSKLLMHRNIIDRIGHLLPFLKLDKTPYVTVTDKGIYWIVDAFTTSDKFPAAATSQLGTQAVNYIRDAAKIVVDAYNGSVDIYIYDEQDPIINAYKRIYPGLFHAKDELPADLKAHARYPRDLFDIQMRIYAKYHQKDPQVFYQQEDLWTFPQALGEHNTVPLKPYFVTLDLIEPNRLDFMLLLPLFPKNRDNLRAVAVAGCDPDHYGKIVIYNFPKGELVYGPAQIDALINQDPDIAEQFTLWDQAGSQIMRGKMIILPVGNSVLFIQPVYLKATSRVKIPELQRIIMSEGEEVVMEKSVQQAYAELKRRVAEGRSPSRAIPPADTGEQGTLPEPPPAAAEPGGGPAAPDAGVAAPSPPPEAPPSERESPTLPPSPPHAGAAQEPSE
jgi:uncharacterized protein